MGCLQGHKPKAKNDTGYKYTVRGASYPDTFNHDPVHLTRKAQRSLCHWGQRTSSGKGAISPWVWAGCGSEDFSEERPCS